LLKKEYKDKKDRLLPFVLKLAHKKTGDKNHLFFLFLKKLNACPNVVLRS